MHERLVFYTTWLKAGIANLSSCPPAVNPRRRRRAKAPYRVRFGRSHPNRDDPAQAEPLRAQGKASIEAVGGDGAYDRRKGFDALAASEPPI